MAFSPELQQKLDYYEQVYYSLDEPIPFKGDLLCYPVLVKDYYNFYNCFGCLSMDKMVKTIVDENGMPKKVSNPKGIGQSYLEYLIDEMKDPLKGPFLTQQLMNLLELVFHIPKGMYCPHCKKVIPYDEVLKNMQSYVEAKKKEMSDIYTALAKEEQKEQKEVEKDKLEIPNELLKQIENMARNEYFLNETICPECGEKLRDVFSLKNDNGICTLIVKDTEINAKDFDEFKALVPRQNILDYDGDMYLDAELKEELELKAKLQNSDYTAPTLEKQLVCVNISTGIGFEELKNYTMRKLSLMLRLIDKKETYYAMFQASMSGMVTFKEGTIKHWVFSDDKKNIKDELTNLDTFEKKFAHVT